MSDSLRPHELQHARPPCPSPTPRVHSLGKRKLISQLDTTTHLLCSVTESCLALWSPMDTHIRMLKIENIQKKEIMASGPFTTWQLDGETMETVTKFIFLGSKITVDSDCSHEIKTCLLLGRKTMTNLDSILKSRDITLLTKIRTLKAMVFPVVMYGCESWTVKKAEHCIIEAFKLWHWRLWESLVQQGDATSQS